MTERSALQQLETSLTEEGWARVASQPSIDSLLGSQRALNSLGVFLWQRCLHFVELLICTIMQLFEEIVNPEAG